MIEDDIGHPRDCRVPRNVDCRCRQSFLQLSVDCQDAVHATRLQETWVLGNQILPVPVVRCKEKVTLLHQKIRRTTQNLGVISFPQFRKQYPDRLCLPALESPGNQAWLVTELLCRGLDSLSRRRGDRSAGGVVQHKGDGCRT